MTGEVATSPVTYAHTDNDGAAEDAGGNTERNARADGYGAREDGHASEADDYSDAGDNYDADAEYDYALGITVPFYQSHILKTCWPLGLNSPATEPCFSLGNALP